MSAAAKPAAEGGRAARARSLAGVGAALLLGGCAPGLTPPSESTRIAGEVADSETGGPVRVAVFEACSRRLLVFRECPGAFLGEAKIPQAGEFVVEVDPRGESVQLVAFRGTAGREVACASRVLPLDGPLRDVRLELEPGPCGLELDLL